MKGARYTRTRRPVQLVYLEKIYGRANAARRELQIKGLKRPDKIKLIKTADPEDL